MGAELAWRLDMLRSTASVAGLRHRRAAYCEDQRLFATSKDPAVEWHAFHRRIWQQAADTVGARLDDLGSGFLALRLGDRSTIVWQYHVMLDDPVTLRLALDKSLGHRLFTEAGLPVAAHLELGADDVGPALRFLAERGGPCVVKPASGTGGGHGVTCGISCPDDMVRACARARRWDHRLLVERQVTGEEHRLLFLDGELLDVVRRRPPVLVGDGRSSVGSLITAENDRRAAAQGRAGLRPLAVDLDSLFTLRASGLSLRSVVAAGVPVRIKSTANANGPGDNETVRDVSSDLVEEAARAASLLGVHLAGVDVITPDPSVSLRSAGGVIVEVNGTPGLHYHYLVANPDAATPVAVPILARLLAAEDRLSASRR